MTNQDKLRAILGEIRISRGLSWREAKLHACGLLVKSPLIMDKWLTVGQSIPDNEIERLQLKWVIEKYWKSLPLKIKRELASILPRI